MVVIWRLSPLCKVVPISESRKFLPACEIRNPGLWNPVACVHTPLPTPIFPEGKRGSVHRLKSEITPTIKSGVQITGDTFQKDWSPKAVQGDSLRLIAYVSLKTRKTALGKSPQCIGLNRDVNSFCRCDQANTASFTHTFAFKKLTLAQTESPK